MEQLGPLIWEIEEELDILVATSVVLQLFLFEKGKGLEGLGIHPKDRTRRKESLILQMGGVSRWIKN